MKFLHCSDIHLGRKPVGAAGDYSIKRFDDYFKVFREAVLLAVSEKTDAIIISGDLFDKKELSPVVLARAEDILAIARDNGIKTLIIEGNHDNISSGFENESWLIYLQNKELIARPSYIFEDEKYVFEPIILNDVNFYGLGYPGAMVNETVKALSEYLEEHKDKKNVVIVHTAITGNDLFAGTIEKDYMNLLKDKAIYVAGGHYHYYHSYPSQNPFFFVPGSLEYWDSGEFNQMKGSVIFDTDTLEYIHHPSNPRKVHRINIKLEKNETENLFSEFKTKLDELEIKENEDIIEININTKDSVMINREEIEKDASLKNPLRIFININYPGITPHGDYSNTNLAIPDIEKEIISQWDYLNSDPENSFDVFEKLKQHQINKNESDFSELFNLWLERLIESEVKSENS